MFIKSEETSQVRPIHICLPNLAGQIRQSARLLCHKFNEAKF